MIFSIGSVNFNIDKVRMSEKEVTDFYTDCDCENCPLSWECRGYEGECEDYGCYIDKDFDTPLFICALPWRIKNLIKKVKGWE